MSARPWSHQFAQSTRAMSASVDVVIFNDFQCHGPMDKICQHIPTLNSSHFQPATVKGDACEVVHWAQLWPDFALQPTSESSESSEYQNRTKFWNHQLWRSTGHHGPMDLETKHGSWTSKASRVSGYTVDVTRIVGGLGIVAPSPPIFFNSCGLIWCCAIPDKEFSPNEKRKARERSWSMVKYGGILTIYW